MLTAPTQVHFSSCCQPNWNGENYNLGGVPYILHESQIRAVCSYAVCVDKCVWTIAVQRYSRHLLLMLTVWLISIHFLGSGGWIAHIFAGRAVQIMSQVGVGLQKTLTRTSLACVTSIATTQKCCITPWFHRARLHVFLLRCGFVPSSTPAILNIRALSSGLSLTKTIIFIPKGAQE